MGWSAIPQGPANFAPTPCTGAVPQEEILSVEGCQNVREVMDGFSNSLDVV